MNSTNRLIICLLLISVASFSQSSPELKISGNYQGLSFIQFVDEVEQAFPIKFYFNKAWIESIQVNLNSDSIPLNKALDKILIHSFLGYYISDEGNVYILPDKSLAPELPDYALSSNESGSTGENVEQLAIEEKYLRGREPDMVETIVIGNAEQYRQGKRTIINGNLTNIETGEPLIGATIYIKELMLGAITDQYGSMSLVLRAGKYAATFECMGMADTKCLIDVLSDGYFKLQMKPQLTSIAEVTVTADQTYSRGSKPGLEKVSIKSVKELPTLMGERDVLKIAQMLPGIVSVGEGSAGINVRGGNVDQNLFYLNDIPVYNTSHLFGFFSAINTNIVNNFSIYKGHVPAEYGGRLSSVFNVETRRGNKNKFFTHGGISPVSAQISAEAPIMKDKASVMVSARSSYSDWILNQMNDPALRNSDASFYDLAGGFDYELNDNNRVNIFGYYSKDKFNLNNLSEYEYSNSGGSLNYLHRFSPGLKSDLTLISSGYTFNIADKSSISAAYQHQYHLRHHEIKYSMSWLLNEKHKLNGGIGSIVYELNRGDVEPYGVESKIERLALGNEKGVESAAFIDETYSPAFWLSINAGLRYSFYNELGPKKVYSYYPGLPMQENTVSDSTEYASGEIVSSYGGPEFRFAIDFKIHHNHSIKLSFVQMRQYLFMLSNTIAVAPNDQWKLADSHLVPPNSNQYSLGYFFSNAAKGINASIEAYYKEAKNIIEYKDGADFLATPYVERTVLQGDQSAYGIEFMLAKSKGNLNGWISYVYSRSEILVDGEHKWDKINNGNKYPANYDKPHVVNVVGSYRVNRRLSFSTNLSYATGRPLTLPQSIFYVKDNPYVEYSERNAYRMPDYFRMDLSLTLEGNLKEKKFMHSYWVFSVYNLTGRKNPHSIYFMSENGLIKGYQYAVIGVPIFTITWNFKLGNYANN